MTLKQFVFGMVILSLLIISGCAPTASAIGAFFSGIYVGVIGILALYYVFIPIVVVIALTIGYLVEDKYEHIIGTSVWFLVLILLFYLTEYLDIFHLMKNDFPRFLLFLVGYGVAGIIWSFIKLRITANKLSREWEEMKKSLPKKGDSEDSWIESCPDNFDRFDFSNHEHKIFSWAVFWPFSILWFLLKDFLREAWEFIYKHMRNAYKWVYEGAIQNIIADKEKFAEIKKAREKERERNRG